MFCLRNSGGEYPVAYHLRPNPSTRRAMLSSCKLKWGCFFQSFSLPNYRYVLHTGVLLATNMICVLCNLIYSMAIVYGNVDHPSRFISPLYLIRKKSNDDEMMIASIECCVCVEFKKSLVNKSFVFFLNVRDNCKSPQS